MARIMMMGDARSVHIERWGRFLAEAGFELALFSLEPKTISWPHRFYAAPCRFSIPLLDYARARKDLKRAIDDFHPHLINAHFVVSYGWMASYYSTCPIVATAWGSDLLLLPQKSLIHRMRVKRALKHASCCTVDNWNLDRAARRYTAQDKIIRIVMGVDRQFFDSAKPTASPSSGALRIIAPRGLQKVYDPQTIIAAAARLRGQIDFKIDLLGEMPESEAIREELTKRSLNDVISVGPFLPHDKFASVLKNYDIYLSASLSDSTSVALLEAMAVGLFPVVSDIEGNREWIEDGVNGLVFRPGSEAALAEALLQAQKMRNRFPEIAETNRARVGKDAIWQDNMERMVEIFRGLIRE